LLACSLLAEFQREFLLFVLHNPPFLWRLEGKR
jgi:hypothetical protein